jgi:hypothetical protein
LNGRQGARWSFWDAIHFGSQSACLGKRPLADPPYVFGAAGRTSDNRNNRTSRRL